MYKVLRIREYEKIKKLEGHKYANGEMYFIPKTKYCCDVVAYDLDRQQRTRFSFSDDKYDGAYDLLMVGDIFDIFPPEDFIGNPVVERHIDSNKGNNDGTVE